MRPGTLGYLLVQLALGVYFVFCLTYPAAGALMVLALFAMYGAYAVLYTGRQA